MSFFKEMDLYKGIILLSVILLPLGGWWISNLDEEISQCEAALRQATKRGGYIEEIGRLQKQIEVVAKNTRSDSIIRDPRTYFEGQILAVSENLKSDHFSPSAPRDEMVTIGRQKATDKVVTIDWGRGSDRKEVQMDFVYAVLFNCESGARAGGGAVNASPSVWRLRSLKLANVTTDKILGRDKTPPPELEDRWYIREMKFARREPRAK